MVNAVPTKRISCLFIVFLLLSMSFSPALAQETNGENGEATPETISEGGEPEEEAFTLPGVKVQRSEFVCESPETHPEKKVLKPEEVAQLKQALHVDSNGFQGKEISSGASPDIDRKELGNPQSAVVIPTGKEGEATLKDIPTKKFSPLEMQHWLSYSIDGPFSFGISLDDTVRIGRCQNLSAMEAAGAGCPVEGKQLYLRNSGEGIVSDFKLVFKDFKSIFTEDAKEFITGEKTIPELTEEEEEALRLNMASEEDLNKLEYKAFTRPVDEVIPNSIKTESFYTSMGSSCNTSDCLISSYSMFDKYYNSWFAADIVISNFGPTLFGQAKRYLNYPARHGWPWTIEQNRLFQSFRRKFMGPDSWYGQYRAQRMVKRVREYGFGEFWTKMVENNDWDSGYAAFKGGGFRKWMNEASKAGGYIDEITDPVRRGEFYKLVRDMRGYSRAQRDIINATHDAYQTALTRYGVGSLEARHAMIEYGKVNYHMMDQLDDLFGMDAPEWWLRDPYANMYPFAVKHSQSGAVVTLVGDSQHIDNIGRKFIADGDWRNFDSWGNMAYETTPEGFLQLYHVSDRGNFIDSVPVEDLKKHFSRFRDKVIQTEKGELLKLDEVNIDYIVSGVPGTGKVKVYDLKWDKAPALTPENFAARLTHSRVRGRFAGNFNENMDHLYDVLVEKNFAGLDRRYLSALDRAMAREEEILKSYFSLRGGAKWTVLPFAYWGAKRGFGYGGISAFMLPETWREIEFYLGEAPLYNDAFVDFFAQHGSDEGDIFRQVLNKLPWKMVLNYISDTYSPVKETFDRLTGRGWRPKVENVAYFTSTGDECAGCNAVLKMRSQETAVSGEGDMSIEFRSRQSMEAFLLEDAISKEARKEGSTLIAYGHHTNVRGKAVDVEQSEETDLVKAQREEETCRDKVKALGLGWVGDPARVGAVLAFGESLTYFIFGWSAIIGSVIQQTLIAPKLQGCTDDQEGYFVHMFAPSEEEQEDQETTSDKASEKASEIIKNVSDTLLGEKDEDDKSTGFVEQAKDKIKEQVEKLEENARSNTILQATVETQGTTDGVFFSQELFFFWFKGETNKAKYDEQTKMHIFDPESDTNILIDNKAGVISINGEPVITSKDHVRLSAPNSKIPAVEIPQRIGQIGLPTDANMLLFTWSVDGHFSVEVSEVLECIKRNVEEQTGIALTSDNIADAFGEVEMVVTNAYSITVDGKTSSITATGAPRRIVYGANARTEIFTNRRTLLKNDEEASVGLLESIQFKNGVIIYKPETHELLIWLKHHDKAIARRSDISGLKATPTTVKNAETDCPEPAINLEALPVAGSGAIAERVENFNQSLEKMGPFQVFDTDKHRFVFYSVKTEPGCDPSTPGCCEDRVKIINKETGEVYDQAIDGPIENTPTGIRFKTADGKEHTLDFSADDGVPRISYDGGAPETLRTATGPNGSFWYDPDTGLWYPENAQLLPLIEAFRQKGFNTAVGPDGRVSTTATGNSLSVQIGADSGMPFNLPSLPTEPIAMLVFVASLLGVIVIFRLRIERGG